ncbi:MAG: S-layer homology domain-containing protein, partial [Oscillospiraceae bacterium]|nr:S-layer homology domain-containing protein [Oscillospiraceae bacterium]
ATFNPTGNVTRAEMATMICRILAGGDNMIVDATKPVPTYTDIRNNPSAAWAESYIEYCTSLGIVSGKGNGIFDPSADVTAAEAAKMVMTTLGYNADIEQFKGIGWDINVMAKANTLQLLDNLQGEISSSVAVTREQVAQLLYNALGAHTVQNYVGTTANTWIGSGANAYHETLLESKFNAQKVTGVVIANEWADLYGEDPLSAGKTRVRVLGTDNMPTDQEYTVNLTTSLEQIGESIIVYRDTTSNRILFGNDQSTDMNVVNEFTAKGDITKSGDFENAIDKNALTKNTEYFVNFGDNLTTTAEVGRYFSIEMTQVVDKDDATLAGTSQNRTTRDVYYRVGRELSSAEYRELQKIINTLIRMEDANQNAETFTYRTSDIIKIGNAWYVPSEFTGRAASPEESGSTKVEYDDWKGFERYYLDNIEAYNATKFTENENGNYIKTVDYNNDGEIDFVLQTRYTVTNVDRIRNDDVTLYLDNVNESVNAKDKIDSIMPFDDLAEDDIVVYAVIDGVAHVYLTDMKTAKIDKVNRNKLTCTTTDGDEYVETGVDNNGVIDKALYYDDTVTGLAGGVTYNLHFDRYGYLAAFTEAGSANFTLLVDGWFNYARGGREYAVKAYIDGKIEDRDVTRGGDLFIYDDDDKIQSLNNSWGLIKAFGTDGNINYTGNTGLKTIVASLNEDGVLTPVDRLSTNTSNKRVIRLIDTGKKVPGNTLTPGTAYTTELNAKTAYDKKDTDKYTGNEVEIRALSSTIYYYVYPTNSDRGNPIVREYTGYNRLPDLKESEIEDVYAVGTLVNRDTTAGNRTYYTANVVVVEVAKNYRGGAEEVLVVDTPVVGNGVTEDTLLVIRANGAMEEIQVDLSASKNIPSIASAGLGSYGPAGTNKVMPGLYKIYETDKTGVYEIEYMNPDAIRASGRYAVGQVSTSEYTSAAQYVEVENFVYNASNNLHDEKLLDSNGDPTTTVKDITDSSKLYTLSYDTRRWEASLEEQTDWTEYMSEGVDRVNDSTGLVREYDVLDRNDSDTHVNANYNDVLIRYDKGNIVYAVSFANLVSSREDTKNADGTYNTSNTNAAQKVWDNVKPSKAGVAGAPTLTFYGEKLTASSDQEFIKDGTHNTTAVSYHDARLTVEAGEVSFSVDGGRVVIPSTTPVVTPNPKEDQEYTGTILGDDGKYYTYSLKQLAGSDVTAFEGQDVFALPDSGEPIPISNFVKAHMPTNKWASARYIFIQNDGNSFTVTYDPFAEEVWDFGGMDDTNTDTIAGVTVDVTAENRVDSAVTTIKRAGASVESIREKWLNLTDSLGGLYGVPNMGVVSAASLPEIGAALAAGYAAVNEAEDAGGTATELNAIYDTQVDALLAAAKVAVQRIAEELPDVYTPNASACKDALKKIVGSDSELLTLDNIFDVYNTYSRQIWVDKGETSTVAAWDADWKDKFSPIAGVNFAGRNYWVDMFRDTVDGLTMVW